MDGFNKVFLIGNLGKDSELKYTPTGQAVASFSLAVGESWRDKDGQRHDKTEWVNIVLWGRMAEGLQKYLTKGKTILVEGKITTRTWDDKDGRKCYKTEVVASNIKLLGGKPSENRDDEGYRTGSAPDEPQQPEQSAPQATEDDSLPF